MSWQVPTLDMAILDVLHLRVQHLEGLLRLERSVATCEREYITAQEEYVAAVSYASLPHRISGQELHSSNIRSAPDWANSVASNRREVAGVSSNGAMQCAKQRLLDVAARLRSAWAAFELVVRNLTLCAHHREHVIRILKQASGDVRLVTIAGLLDAGRATYHLIAQYQTAQECAGLDVRAGNWCLRKLSTLMSTVADSSLSVHGLLEQLHHLELVVEREFEAVAKTNEVHRVLQALPETGAVSDYVAQANILSKNDIVLQCRSYIILVLAEADQEDSARDQSPVAHSLFERGSR
ncbi:hypothetical protein BKA62DRAFT_761973 [Auriculariales sp. MPI-PUGE-AT-0066]|nr:hypothetical protein BKA62DRAFT_761973 [Auriculariales sp. MPI-PUGE-AT-0066]